MSLIKHVSAREHLLESGIYLDGVSILRDDLFYTNMRRLYITKAIDRSLLGLFFLSSFYILAQSQFCFLIRGELPRCRVISFTTSFVFAHGNEAHTTLSHERSV